MGAFYGTWERAEQITYADARRLLWWARKDLNLEPMDYESSALTVELRAHSVTGRTRSLFDFTEAFPRRGCGCLQQYCSVVPTQQRRRIASHAAHLSCK